MISDNTSSVLNISTFLPFYLNISVLKLIVFIFDCIYLLLQNIDSIYYSTSFFILLNKT